MAKAFHETINKRIEDLLDKAIRHYCDNDVIVSVLDDEGNRQQGMVDFVQFHDDRLHCKLYVEDPATGLRVQGQKWANELYDMGELEIVSSKPVEEAA